MAGRPLMVRWNFPKPHPRGAGASSAAVDRWINRAPLPISKVLVIRSAEQRGLILRRASLPDGSVRLALAAFWVFIDDISSMEAEVSWPLAAWRTGAAAYSLLRKIWG